MTNVIKTFEELYNSATGVVGINFHDSFEDLAEATDELDNNPDFTFLGQFESTQDIDDELEYQGLTLDEITKMSLNQYGNCLEVHEYNNVYHAYIGAR